MTQREKDMRMRAGWQPLPDSADHSVAEILSRCCLTFRPELTLAAAGSLNAAAVAAAACSARHCTLCDIAHMSEAIGTGNELACQRETTTP